MPIPVERRLALLAITMSIVFALYGSPVEAQIRGSERSRVSQVSDGTTVTIDYARPHVRGRAPVFPDLIGWGHVWTPGANSATVFEVDRDVKLNGVDVPAGSYSVWFVPQDGAWLFGLHDDELLYHTQPPEIDELIRLEVTPEETEFTEALTWEFARVRRDGMDVRFRWDDVRVDLRVEVQPTAVADVPVEEAQAIVGRYEVTFAGPPPADAPAGAAPPALPTEFRYEGGRLVGAMGVGTPRVDEFEMLPRAAWVFSPGWMMDGEVMETELEMFFEFVVTDGEVTGFDVRGFVEGRIDRLMMRGERVR